MIENINNLKLRQIQPGEVVSSPKTSVQKKAQNYEKSFEKMLKDKLEGTDTLQFSKHSRERIEQRGIEVDEKLISSLNDAAKSARLKGAKDVVIIGPEAAFIVNIPNNIIVTAMNGNEMKNNIFTNIDGAVMI